MYYAYFTDKNIHTHNNNEINKLSNKSAEAKIPLHAGSRVYVSKQDLAKIFIPNACIYTSRLSELVFGLDVLENIARSNAKQRLLMLEENLLKSIISKLPFLYFSYINNLSIFNSSRSPGIFNERRNH